MLAKSNDATKDGGSESRFVVSWPGGRVNRGLFNGEYNLECPYRPVE